MPGPERGRRRFRPTLWPTLFTVPALMVMLGLGVWQVQRLHWKLDLIADRAAQLAAPALARPSEVEPARDAFRHIVVEGVFRHEKEMYLAARSLRGNVGYQVVAPLRLADGSHLLVNRGWVPHDRKDPASRAEGQVAGPVRIEGIIREDGRPSIFAPENEPAHNIWFTVDIAAMARWAGLERVADFVVEAGPAENPGGLPIGGQTRVELRNEHLQYAIIWFALAGALAVIYVIYHMRRPEEDEG